jgi:hypothetical protein
MITLVQPDEADDSQMGKVVLQSSYGKSDETALQEVAAESVSKLT